jgi:hypothetical protein
MMIWLEITTETTKTRPKTQARTETVCLLLEINVGKPAVRPEKQRNGGHGIKEDQQQ